VPRVQEARAFGSTQLVITGATAVMLGIGRFAALPYQRRSAENQMPKQNGETHSSAGDACVLSAYSCPDLVFAM
jgi:photosystem I reaction center subunit V